MNNPTGIIYLACPYTHSEPDVMEERYKLVNKVAAHLIENGLVVFSPITMTHPIDKLLARDGVTLGSDYWLRFDHLFMHVCSKIIVLMIQGWQQSRGVQREIAFFQKMGKKVEYLDPSLIENNGRTENQSRHRVAKVP